MDYAKKVKPLQGKSVTSAEKTGEYVDRPGQVAGEIRLVRSWFAIGQAVRSWFISCGVCCS